MPLLTSPIDGSPMKQINRYGIEIDVCPTTGGIWLDRGELEKLMALLREEATNDRPETYRSETYRRSQEEIKSRPYRDDDDYDDDRYRRDYKRKGKMSKIMDIFDF